MQFLEINFYDIEIFLRRTFLQVNFLKYIDRKYLTKTFVSTANPLRLASSINFNQRPVMLVIVKNKVETNVKLILV